MDDPVLTEADWWMVLHGRAARWRMSRTVQWCANRRLSADQPGRCPAGPAVPAIERGDRYFGLEVGHDRRRLIPGRDFERRVG